MNVAIVRFLGTNCEWDMHHAYTMLGARPCFVWFADSALPKGTDLVILPGGFSYGDYLRCGAIARFAPIMSAVAEFAKKGGRVLGICNGFQILLESGLLQGALMRNHSGLACAFRLRMPMAAITRQTTNRCANMTRFCSAMTTTQTAPCTPSPESATRQRTSLGSCPTPSAPWNPCLAAPMA